MNAMVIRNKPEQTGANCVHYKLPCVNDTRGRAITRLKLAHTHTGMYRRLTCINTKCVRNLIRAFHSVQLLMHLTVAKVFDYILVKD